MASIVTKVRELLHSVRIWFYPADNLVGGEGKFFARTAHEKVSRVEDICAAAINRRDHEGEYLQMVSTIYQFLDVMVYQLLDAFSVNLGYFTIYPQVTGFFDSVTEPYNKKNNPIKFRFRANQKMQRLIDEIEILTEGVADTSGGIFSCKDADENVLNEITVPGNLFVLEGEKIMIAGDDPGVGVYFKDAGNSGAEVKVTRIAYNTSTRIIGITPNTAALRNRIVIRTQFNGSGSHLLKEPRTITSAFVLDQV